MKGILFDLEGTIVDSKFARRTPEVAEQERRDIRNKIIDFGVPDEVLEGLDRPPLLWNKALDWIEANMTPANLIQLSEELDAFMRSTEMHSARQARLYPDTKEALSRLLDMGFRMGVTTNACREAADYMLNNLGLIDFFEVVVTRNDAPRNKPHPAMIYIAASEMGVPLGWLVGDTVYDAIAALRAGIKSIIIRRDGERPLFSHDYFVNSLIEVVSIVKETLAP